MHLLEGSLDELLNSYKEFLISNFGIESSIAPKRYLTNQDRSLDVMNLDLFFREFSNENNELRRLRFRDKIQSVTQTPKKFCLICQEAVGLIYYEKDPYPWWKNWYYATKFKCNGDVMARKEIAQRYFSGLVWYFGYMTNGISSWDFEYPEIYAPPLSDLVSLDDFESKMLDLLKKVVRFSVF